MIDKRGLKRSCPKCGAIFYDMGKKDFACPKCGKKFNTESYQQEKNKVLTQKIKHEAAHLEDEIDTETLIKMANTQIEETDKEADDLMPFEESDSEDMREFGDLMDDYGQEKEI